MAQQTAVEWLINYCERENWSLPSEIEQIAKAMEKEQIAKARIDLFFKLNTIPYGIDYLHKRDDIIQDAEQYYNETYNK